MSSIPLKDLFQLFHGIYIPAEIFHATQNLQYRDFITVGFLLKNLNLYLPLIFLNRIIENFGLKKR